MLLTDDRVDRVLPVVDRVVTATPARDSGDGVDDCDWEMMAGVAALVPLIEAQNEVFNNFTAVCVLPRAVDGGGL